jgi:uncharacterized protein YdeI (YjbR/CyaY-like superfamily)
MAMVADGLPELIVADADTWREWLRVHHETSTGVGLVLAKKGTTDPTTLTYDLALEEALCQGWIDGQAGRRDEGTYRQRFTPRRARSQWSARNLGIVSALLSQGRMQPAGLSQVERAKTDVRWEAAYAGQAGMEVPADLDAALTAVPGARAMFEILSSQNLMPCCTGSRMPSALRLGPVASSSSSTCSAGARRSIHRNAPSPADGGIADRQSGLRVDGGRGLRTSGMPTAAFCGQRWGGTWVPPQRPVLASWCQRVMTTLSAFVSAARPKVS